MTLEQMRFWLRVLSVVVLVMVLAAYFAFHYHLERVGGGLVGLCILGAVQIKVLSYRMDEREDYEEHQRQYGRRMNRDHR